MPDVHTLRDLGKRKAIKSEQTRRTARNLRDSEPPKGARQRHNALLKIWSLRGTESLEWLPVNLNNQSPKADHRDDEPAPAPPVRMRAAGHAEEEPRVLVLTEPNTTDRVPTTFKMGVQ